MASPSSYPIPNLIQGVSQQAPMQRRDTQCEAQFDCINDVVNGATARPGFDLASFLLGENFEGHFFYEINRGITEHYLVVIGGDDLRVFNLMDGSEATVLFPDAKDYLDEGADVREVFAAATVEDHTFIANRNRIPAMDSMNTAPTDLNEALVHFRAGGYLVTYQVSVIHDGNNYTFTYKTPDNATAANADAITTNQIAATFYRAFTGSAATILTSGDPATGAGAFGVGASHAGSTTGVTAPITLTSLGFVIAINGSAVRIRRDDAEPFTVDVSDGVGNSHIKVAKGIVQNFSDLPQFGFEGFTVKVKGEDSTEEDDYYVKFISNGAGGHWEETAQPGVVVGFDPETMPHQLVNTALNEFTFEQAPWGERVVGDAVSAPDPSFVGIPIEDIFHDNDRLAIITEGACVWSKTRNPYVFFTDSVQTRLATDPIDIQISGSKTIALLRRSVQHGGGTFLWAQKSQFSVGSGSEPFTADTVKSKRVSAYEFVEAGELASVGNSLYFATEAGGFATIRDLFIREGVSIDHTDVTAHVSQYIPAGVRRITASDTMNMLFITSDEAPSHLFAYNWFLESRQSEGERLQSAWNTWRLPEDCIILWAGVFRAELLLLVQRTDGVAILKADLSRDRKDPSSTYLTRLDLRVTEADCSVVYDSMTDTTEIELPFIPTELDPEAAKPVLIVVVREDGDHPRGREFKVLDVVGDTVAVEGDAESHSFYAGYRITALRKESEFWLRSERGVIPADRLQAIFYRILHARSGYYRAEVEYINGNTQSYEWEGRKFGDPQNVIGQVGIANGLFNVPITGENTFFAVTLINDSFLPSHWQTAEFGYQATIRTRSTGAGNP